MTTYVRNNTNSGEPGREAIGLRIKLSTQGYHSLDSLEFHEIQDIEI